MCCETRQPAQERGCGCRCHCEPESDRAEEEALRAWQGAFAAASHELRVELLKERLRKTWGEGLGPVADSVMELMRSDWLFSQGRGDAGERDRQLREFSERLRALLEKGPQ